MDRGGWMDACGDLGDAPAPLRALVLSNGIAEPLPEPDRQDWLAIHDERGQTFQEFTRSVSRPHTGETTIYVQPVDTGDALTQTCLSTLAAFAGAFFQRPTRMLPPLALESSALTVRAAPDADTPQVYAGDILTTLYAGKHAEAEWAAARVSV